MTLKSYLALITLSTITLLIIAAAAMFGYVLRTAYLDNISQRGLELARVIAHDDTVIKAVKNSNQGQAANIQQYVEDMRQQTDASFIVVVNAQALRLSHPLAERVGQAFVGEDIYPVLKMGQSYTNVAKGSLGEAIRNFTPVFDQDKIIGAVSVGYLSKTTSELIYQHLKEAAWLVILLYFIGVLIAMIFIAKLKRTFLTLEPEEIVHKFKEQELILDSIRDGIIAVNHEQQITAVNSMAMEWLTMKALTPNEVINKSLKHYSQSLSHFALEAQGHIIQRHFSIGKLDFLATLYPLAYAKDNFGYVIVFYPDHGEKSLEQELTSTKNYADLLRAKTHEYTNRLNVLSGMLQAERYPEAVEFLQQESDGDQAMLRQIIQTIENSAVAGLIFAKHNKAKDLQLELLIDSDCQLGLYSPQVNEALVTLLGNLLDNAMLAAWHNRHVRTAFVKLFISDRNAHIMLQVEDSGAGIDAKLENRILDFGVSSKHNTEQNGIGLYLVRKIVDQFHGSLDWERSEENTTVFSIYLDKQALKR